MVWNKQCNDIFLLNSFKFCSAIRSGMINLSKNDYNELSVFDMRLFYLINSELDEYSKFMNQGAGRFY